MAVYLELGLLALCWITALLTLVVFLESCFAPTHRARFVPARSSGAYGLLSVYLPVSGSASALQRTVQSVFRQSYPFTELILVYYDKDPALSALASHLSKVRSHIPVRLASVPFALNTEYDRIRALESVQSVARGRWFVVLSPDVILDRHALEYALEFAGSNELSALALDSGRSRRTWAARLIAPSLEYFVHVIRMLCGRRDRHSRMNVMEQVLVVNREAFQIVNRVNRMPGILNESGWNLWSYRAEGLRTVDADGSRWFWLDRQDASSALPSEAALYGRRAAGFVVASMLMALATITGIGYCAWQGLQAFAGASILSFALVSYGLMTASYWMYARRLGVASWPAPLWFLFHLPAAATLLVGIRRQRRASVQSAVPAARAGSRSAR